MQQLQGAVRNYAWGSHTAIAELSGRPTPSPEPEAELWFGAHPANPSILLGQPETSQPERTLRSAIEQDLQGQLGQACSARFGPRLPYLLKVLAVDAPLSLQVHPSSEQAQQGYAAEESRRVPLDSPIRSYRDQSHKPELVCALTRFEALVGFRQIDRTVGLLRALDCPGLHEYAALLAQRPNTDGLRRLFTAWMTLPSAALDALLPAVLQRCAALAETDGEFAAEAATAVELGRRYPGDTGALASLLLNRVTLQPGQAVYLPAGNLHAYLNGVAVEAMANSDNVLRCGLTPKHVDVPELLRVLNFVAGDLDVLTGTEVVDCTGYGSELEYRTDAPEFRLSRVELAADAACALHYEGPQILLVTAGSVHCTSRGRTIELNQGAAAWLPAVGPEVRVVAEGDGAQVFRVRDGLRQA